MSVDVVIKADAVGLNNNSTFASDQSLLSLKERFYAMTGFDIKTMKFTVNGKPVTDESAPLSSYQTGTDPLTIEITGKSEFGDLNDDSVEKYELDDAVYDKLEGTVRDIKRKAGIPVKGEVRKKYEEPITDVKVGERCEIQLSDGSHHRGEVMYVGTLESAKGYFVGVKLDEPFGKNNGTHEGKTYFSCDQNYGIFVRRAKVKVGDYPEIDWEKELEDEM
jgi:tubulin-folding cofactor B